MIKDIGIDELMSLKNLTMNFDIETKYKTEDFHNQHVRIIQFKPLNSTQPYRIKVDSSQPMTELEIVFKEVYSTWSLIGHNLQFDVAQIYHHYHVLPKSISQDTYVLARMLQEPKQGLKDLCQKYLNVPKPKFDFPTKLLTQPEEYDYDDPSFDEYSTYDVTYPEQLANYFLTTHQSYLKCMEYVYSLELALIPVVAKMQSDGLNFDMKQYPTILAQFEDQVNQKEQSLFNEVGHSFRVTSNADLQKLLFEEMNLVPRLFTPNGAPSVNQEALAYHEGNPIVDQISSLKSDKSVLNSFKNIPKSIFNDKVYPEFKVIGYDGTSRIYTDPSVNQWPRIARTLITPDKGNKFVYFDLSAAELYVALYWSRQEDFLEVYRNKGDLHSFVASKIMHKPIETITKEQREAAKVVTFSILFGSEGQAAARKLKLSEDEGIYFVNTWFKQFPKVKENNNNLIDFANHTGYTQTILGRKRKLQMFRGQISKSASRQAVNTAIQASVADFQKLILVRLFKLGINVKFTVFDSFLLEVPEDTNIEDLKLQLDKVVDFSNKFEGFKFNYSVGEGHTWYEAQENS